MSPTPSDKDSTCMHCAAQIHHSRPDELYPDGLWWATESQGMSNRTACPRRPESMGYPQPHEPGKRPEADMTPFIGPGQLAVNMFLAELKRREAERGE